MHLLHAMQISNPDRMQCWRPGLRHSTRRCIHGAAAGKQSGGQPVQAEQLKVSCAGGPAHRGRWRLPPSSRCCTCRLLKRTIEAFSHPQQQLPQFLQHRCASLASQSNKSMMPSFDFYRQSAEGAADCLPKKCRLVCCMCRNLKSVICGRTVNKKSHAGSRSWNPICHWHCLWGTILHIRLPRLSVHCRQWIPGKCGAKRICECVRGGASGVNERQGVARCP